jgi:maleate isomerase
MTHHFGVLIPSTNTTVETELARLPTGYQAHFARLLSRTPGNPFGPSRDEDIDYQSKLLGTAKVEMIILMQTSASLFTDDYDAVTTRRMSAAARGVPAITSAHAIASALSALGAKRIGLVSPYSEEVNALARRYFSGKHGLEIAVLEGFAAKDSYAIGNLGPENARAAFARIDRPEIEAFAVPGANFPTMASIAAWEREFKKPVVSSTQAAVWAMARQLGGEPIAGFGRLLQQMPVG